MLWRGGRACANEAGSRAAVASHPAHDTASGDATDQRGKARISESPRRPASTARPRTFSAHLDGARGLGM